MKKKMFFLVLILINVFVFSSCTKETSHEHLYIDGKCECGDKEISETNYKEVSFDEEMLFKKTEVDEHYQIESSFHKIIQDDEKIKQSVPILEFSKIDEKYIGIYVDKAFMETIRMELSDSRRKAFEDKIPEVNWNLHNKLKKNQILYSYYSQNELSCELVMLYYSIINDNEDICYDINNVIINRENTKVKYYELNKKDKIPTIIEDYEILGLYGSRNIKVTDDLYTDDNIGKEMKVYFGIPGLI